MTCVTVLLRREYAFQCWIVIQNVNEYSWPFVDWLWKGTKNAACMFRLNHFWFVMCRIRLDTIGRKIWASGAQLVTKQKISICYLFLLIFLPSSLLGDFCWAFVADFSVESLKFVCSRLAALITESSTAPGCFTLFFLLESSFHVQKLASSSSSFYL